MTNTLIVIIAAIAGLLIGGLINLLADDLPQTLRIRGPHYPDGTPRPPIAWLGLSAFLFGKRTTESGSKLSWRQPIVEIVTAALFVYIAQADPFSARSLFWMGNTAILMLITVIDLEHRLILFVVIIPACVYALVGAALVWPEISTKVLFQDYIFGGIAGFILFFLMYLGGMLFSNIMAQSRGEELEEVAFGYGDVLLATLSGFMLGWQALIFAVFIAIFAGAAGALAFITFRLFAKGKYQLFTALPYGQYIVFGTILMMLWRTPVMNFLQNH